MRFFGSAFLKHLYLFHANGQSLKNEFLQLKTFLCEFLKSSVVNNNNKCAKKNKMGMLDYALNNVSSIIHHDMISFILTQLQQEVQKKIYKTKPMKTTKETTTMDLNLHN
jgi:hypothetical protein